MTWKNEKTNSGNELVWEGGEMGIGPSPLKGTANLQNVNIATESGQVLASYGRVNQAQLPIDPYGTLNPDGATLFDAIIPLTAFPASLYAGYWIAVDNSTISSIPDTVYPTTVDLDYLVVGGGGGGGGAKSSATNLDASGGGGGAGAVVTGTTAIGVGIYAVVVGNGGDGGTIAPTVGEDGEDSTLGALVTAPGGGGGGSSAAASDDGANGGSGGGGGSDDTAGTAGTGGTGTPDFDGGDGFSGKGGGGGGANQNGVTAASNGGDGGDGDVSSITGTATFYGGGGGGGDAGGVSPVAGSGGQGGGGDGGDTTGSGVPTPATAGTANTGGGGGGGGTTDSMEMAGANGGSGIVVVSYDTGTMIASGGDLVYISGTKTIHVFTTNGSFIVTSITPENLYYVSFRSGSDSAPKVKLSAKFDPTGANPITHGTTGSAEFTLVATVGKGIAKATEKYTTATSTEFRYYILDDEGYVWVYDTNIFNTYGTTWMLPDPNDYGGRVYSGIGALNGQLLVVGVAQIYGKPTVNLGATFYALDNSYLNEPFPTHTNFALVGNQGKMYYCDGNYIGEVFPTTSIITSIANIQSMSQYTASGSTGTISQIVTGSLPYDPGGTRIPAVFFTDVYGTQPTNMTIGTVYYIEYDPATQTFELYNAITGGSAKTISTGAVGNQFFTTFYPYGSVAGYGGTSPLVQITTQRMNLPSNETAQCMVEIGNTVIIGGITNQIYPWNQIDATPSDIIALPEANVKTMINVNNIAYVFAGNKGNIYVTNGSVGSLALKVPDYIAGVPGTSLTYIEPVYYWGDSEYVRGRVYFSLLDQTSTKAGNAGGVWSFIPAQNVDPSQEVGMALRLENQNSYATYNGLANLIIGAQEQDAASPRYWTSWQDSYSTATSSFGIDYTSGVPVTSFVIETDLIPSGTMLEKTSFSQLEYKVATPLAAGDSVQLFYRLNATDTWTTCGTVKEETDRISGYFTANFQKTQWTQIRAEVTTAGTLASSFCRLTQIRLR